ncbi:hypothetical protein KVR01_008317 [Diaporthe batatas]|uniref:uncharacterized protein n=1 Tax=Diaporthe batatas TaxID=748121 RepID=UPI001D050247|nr:uncharacterized protein KVR01_008317 [Diaporthe batatas]KAG8162552.1 hypothetical protein KVR01_008317 [Diaporthe batatas]
MAPETSRGGRDQNTPGSRKMTATGASNDKMPAAAARDATIRDVKDGMDQLNAAVQGFCSSDVDDAADKAQRQKIIEAAQNVLNSVKRPDDIWVDMNMDIARMAACQLLYKWGAFEAIPVDGSISYQDLAVATDAEEALLRRVGGVLVSQGYLKQTGADHIHHTPKSVGYRSENASSHVLNMSWTNAFVPYAKLPEYFEQYGRKEPQETSHVPMSFAYGRPELPFYGLLGTDEAWVGSFLKGMAHVESRMPVTAGIYDFSWLVSAVRAEDEEPARATPDSEHEARAVLVDVGGGKGGAVRAIHREFPGLPIRRFVLEDTPEMLEAGRLLDEPELAGVRRVALDFHRDQPVKGAYTYWMRRCFHNYSDDVSRNMLRIIVDAMAEDSRLLIQEDVLDNPPNQWAAYLDFMMLGLGGKQRTLQNWEQLLGSVGLRIASVTRGEGPWKSLSVIEAVKQ